MKQLDIKSTTPEIWGGVECSVVRVGDSYTDQLRRNGHHERLDDIDRFAELGLKTLRFPVLWERTAPDAPNQYDWAWSDARLFKLWQLGMRPIVGLLHHGSGPRYATFDRPDFPEQFAQYARAVAERYPWVGDYTPVNEPITTARFAGLYGLWYPHESSSENFAKILLNELKATVLAMREIRQVRPDARLIQTEDLGMTHATPALQQQADFENRRRWLTFDVLHGHVVPGHPMYDHLRKMGISEKDLFFFAENPCPPDVLGLNHYLTSERFLDHRLENFPPHLHGGNHRYAYADTEAVRVPDATRLGVEGLLRQVWQRYHRPLAVTEVHLGCTREEQLRWFHEVWQAACRLREQGADLQAVTAWALLGSHDWDSLLIQQHDHYEAGVFDIRSQNPRPTALARLIGQLIRPAGSSLTPKQEPTLVERGWWGRDECAYGHLLLNEDPLTDFSNFLKRPDKSNDAKASQPLLILGATGTLGQAFARIARQRGLAFRLLNRQELDIAKPDAVHQILNALRPWAVINAAGYVRVDQAENEPERCFRENLTGATALAEACAQRGIRLLTFSSDLVFDGQKGRSYVESDPAQPNSVYGASKASAEQRVLAYLPEALVVRTSAFFGPWDEYNFAITSLRKLFAEEAFDASDRVVVSPTYVPDLVHHSLDLLIDGATGIWHLTNAGEVSWAAFARTLALRAGLSPGRAQQWYAIQQANSVHLPAVNTALSSEKALLMPALDSAVDRYLRDCVHRFEAVLA